MNALSLTRAFVRGAALAAVGLGACGDSPPTGQESPAPGQGTQPDPQTPEREPQAPEPEGMKLDPIPVRIYPDCFGPFHMPEPGTLGYYGQCCGEVKCLEPESDECPEVSSDAVWRLGPPGSGECGCGENEGPFLWSNSAPELEDRGCCYVIYSIGCDGRPLKCDGQVVVASVVHRTDWVGTSPFPSWSRTPPVG